MTEKTLTRGQKAAATRARNRAAATTAGKPTTVTLNMQDIGYLVEGLDAVQQAAEGFSKFDTATLGLTLDNGNQVTAVYDRADGGWKLLISSKGLG